MNSAEIYAKKKLFSRIHVRVPNGYEVYTPDKFQETIHFSDEKRKVLCLGRRRGKTLVDSIELVWELGKPQTRNWIVAPNYETTGKVFDRVWDIVVNQEIFGPGSVIRRRNSSQERYIELSWGSWVKGKSTEATRSIKGEDLTGLVYDECAIDPTDHIWTEYLEPCLLDHNGWAIFSSTPRGFNWFHTIYELGMDGDQLEWRSWHSPSWENEYISEAALEAIKRNCDETTWRQEYGAEFVAYSGLVYPEFVDKYYPDGHLYNPQNQFPENPVCHSRAIDIGWKHPTVCGWFAIEQGSNNVWVTQEYKEVETPHDQHARNIAAISLDPVASTFISPDAHRTDAKFATDINLTVAKLYRDAGIYTTPASNRVNEGIDVVRRYLRATLDKNSTHPKVFISERCPNLIAGLKRYEWEKPKSISTLSRSQKPHKHKDDEADMFRYGLASGLRYTSRLQYTDDPRAYLPRKQIRTGNLPRFQLGSSYSVNSITKNNPKRKRRSYIYMGNS